MEWMLMPFRRYAEFSGRSRRLEFWMFQLLNLIFAAVLAGPAYFIFIRQIVASVEAQENGMADNMDMVAAFTSSPIALALLGLYGLYVLIAFIPAIAVTVRRLHDRNMSGWWYLGIFLLSLIPLVGLLASLGFLVIMFLDGTPGPNRFGPDPKGRADLGVFS